jgi:hypothetical protein
MGTPQPTYLPRTITSHRVDGAEPSVAQYERTLAHCAAHLVALRIVGEARARPWDRAGFDGISGSETVATPPRPP